MRQAFLLQAHAATRGLAQHFQDFKSQTQRLGHCSILLHAREGVTESGLEAHDRHLITDRCLKLLDFPMIGETLIPGHPHFCLLLYSRDHPEFDYYWVVEYDVRYSGAWRVFFEHFDGLDADLLTSHIYPYETMPEWPWWELTHPHQRVALSQRLRSFNPIYRISQKALRLIDEGHRSGWRGHFEVLLPTLLARAGMRIEDIGGDGPFVPACRKNRFYVSPLPMIDGSLEEGTFRFRPTFPKAGEETDTLYHPVKEPGAHLWDCIAGKSS